MRNANLGVASILGMLAVAGLMTGGHPGSMAAFAAPQPTAAPVSSGADVPLSAARTAVFHWHYEEPRSGVNYDYDIHGTSTAALWKATINEGGPHILSGTISLVQYQQFLESLVQRHIWTAPDRSKSPGLADLPREDVTLSLAGRSRHLPLLYQTGDGTDRQIVGLTDYIESSIAAQPLHHAEKQR